MSIQDRPTPESDEVFGPELFGIRAETCRRLERERDYAIFHGNRCAKELNAEIDKLNEEIEKWKSVTNVDSPENFY